MSAPPTLPKAPHPHDPEKLKKLAGELGIPILSYEEYQAPNFNSALGFHNKPNGKEPDVTVMVIENVDPDDDLVLRHSRYAAALANAYADGLSGTDIEVICLDAQPQINGFPTEIGKSHSPEAIAAQRQLYTHADVASVSMVIFDPRLGYDEQYVKETKSLWQDVNTLIPISAGNYRGIHRLTSQDLSGLRQYAHYSMGIGAAELDNNGEYRMASYSSPNGPTFVMPVTSGDSENPSDAHFKYYDEKWLKQYVVEDTNKRLAEHVTLDLQLILRNGYLSIAAHKIPDIIERGAERTVYLQPDEKKENVADVKARHRTLLHAHLFPAVKQKLLQHYPAATLPDDDTLHSVITDYIRNGRTEIPMDDSVQRDIRQTVQKHTHSFYTQIDNTSNTAAQEIFALRRDKHIKERLARIDARTDTEQYNQNIIGTSFAAPPAGGMMAAGLATLKQAQPELAQEDILWAMAATARPVYLVEGRPDAALPYSENAAGLRYNDTHAGFGVPDFSAARTLLKQGALPPFERKEVSNGQLQDSGKTEESHVYTINIPEGINTTKATIELTFSRKRGSGEMTLVSPNGDAVLLPYTTGGHQKSTASTNVFLNTQGQGEWKVIIPPTESLDNATLTLQGLTPDEMRMNRRPPAREPLRPIPELDRQPQIYAQSFPIPKTKQSVGQPPNPDQHMQRALQQVTQEGLPAQNTISPSGQETGNATLPRLPAQHLESSVKPL